MDTYMIKGFITKLNIWHFEAKYYIYLISLYYIIATI